MPYARAVDKLRVSENWLPCRIVGTNGRMKNYVTRSFIIRSQFVGSVARMGEKRIINVNRNTLSEEIIRKTQG
jgi:hypothetical protein